MCFPSLKSHPETRQSSANVASSSNQNSQGLLASFRSRTTSLFARHTGHANPSQPVGLPNLVADVGQDSGQSIREETVAEEFPDTGSGHRRVPHSDGNRNVPHDPEVNDSATGVTDQPNSGEGNEACRNAGEVIRGLQPVSGPVPAADISKLLEMLSQFNDLVDAIAEIHPYAKAAWGVLSVVLKAITSQAACDDSINRLLLKMEYVYELLAQENTPELVSMKSVVRKVCQQTIECAYFLRDYSKSKNFWVRLGKNVLSAADNKINGYNNVFDDLVGQFQDKAARDTVVVAHWVLEGIQELGGGADLSRMECAKGAGLDTRKKCLPGTREEILDEITTWINNAEDDTPRVFWLHGNAGTGKSSIAHTIADRFKELGRLGSCYCFDRTREAQLRHEKVFTTIARGLADRDKQMRFVLANIVHQDNSLSNTPNIMQQWTELIVKPASKLSQAMVGPILIVIEALDESGDDTTRQHLLQILAGKSGDDATHINKLPSNFRFLVTSRTLPDIQDALNNVEHIRHKTMDTIPSTTTERDVLKYITNELSGIPGVRGDQDSRSIASKAGGLFEWAHLACEQIRRQNYGSLSAPERVTAVISQVSLLDQMFKSTLESVYPRNQLQRAESLTRFRSVMPQLLGTLEPLPLSSLCSMRTYFSEDNNSDIVTLVVTPIGALLSGTTNSSVVRPLHGSLYEFLKDEQRSGEFFVDTSRVHKDLAFMSLAIMNGKLPSYLPKSEISDPHERVKQNITPELSYSCRFWTDHLRRSDFDLELADAVRDFFNDEWLPLWSDVLSLCNTTETTAVLLSYVIDWAEPHSVDCKDILDNAKRFIRRKVDK